jgi:hypothetical protein
MGAKDPMELEMGKFELSEEVLVLLLLVAEED